MTDGDRVYEVAREEFAALDIEVRHDPLWEQAHELHQQLVDKYMPVINRRIAERLPDGPVVSVNLKIGQQINFEGGY